MTLQENLQQNKPLMWSEKIGNEVYVYHYGELIYKRWHKKGSTEKSQPSIIINKSWPNEWIY